MLTPNALDLAIRAAGLVIIIALLVRAWWRRRDRRDARARALDFVNAHSPRK